MKLTVTTDTSDVDFVVCAKLTTPMLLADNLTGVCSWCATRIQFRPHVPKAPKLCIDCAASDFDDEAELVVTPTTMQEVRNLIKKQRH